jgi:predicted AAA+ superfamily ATPase
MVLRMLNPLKSNSFFVFGARGTGKSTFIKQQFLERAMGPQKVWTVDLLDDEVFDRYLTNPSLLEADYRGLKAKPVWVFIDEVQRVPKILNQVHRLIENSNQKFILTGSSARKLKLVGANLLAGRSFLNYLFPFSAFELNDQFNLLTALHFGLLPKVYFSEREEQIQFLKSYIQLYIREEILQEQLVKDLESFRYFLEIAAQMNGKIVHATKIATEVNVDPKTIRKYFGILEDTYLGFFLPSFHRSVRKGQTLHPKFYFFDIGVKRALDRSLNDTFSENSAPFGEAFEHFIILEFMKLNFYKQLDYRLSFFRTKEGKEIDLILSRGRKTILIEIKSKSKVRAPDFENLVHLRDELRATDCYLLSNDKNNSVIDGVHCCHWKDGLQQIMT